MLLDIDKVRCRHCGLEQVEVSKVADYEYPEVPTLMLFQCRKLECKVCGSTELRPEQPIFTRKALIAFRLNSANPITRAEQKVITEVLESLTIDDTPIPAFNMPQAFA